MVTANATFNKLKFAQIVFRSCLTILRRQKERIVPTAKRFHACCFSEQKGVLSENLAVRYGNAFQYVKIKTVFCKLKAWRGGKRWKGSSETRRGKKAELQVKKEYMRFACTPIAIDGAF